MPKISKALQAAKLAEADREDRDRAERQEERDERAGRVLARDLHHIPDVLPRRSAEDIVVLAVDPGEEHVGVAVGRRDLEYAPGGPRPKGFGWFVSDVAELNPWEFVQFFRDNIDGIDLLSVEKYTLYPHLAKEQIGSEMPTSKLIGWIEFTVRLWNESFTKEHTPAHGMPEIQYESYPANIHKGTEAVMKNKGIPFVSPKTPDHARSAELHFWHTLIRAGLVEGVTLA